MLTLRYRAALAVLVLLSPAVAGSQSPAPQAPPQIVTSGEGEVRVTPDRAMVSIGVQTRALTAADASNQNARKQRAVIDAIKAKGVAVDKIGTSGFNVQPETKYQPNQAPVTTAYLVSNTVTVDLQRVDLVGGVIDASIAAGANQVHSLSFLITNPDSARREALAIAVARARGDAEVAARAAGGSLGTLIELMATQYDVPVFRAEMGMARARVAAESPVEAGQQSVRANVTVRWQFVPGR